MFSRGLNVVFGLAILGASGWVAWLAIAGFGRWLHAVDDKIGPPIVAGTVAVSLALFGFWREIRKSRLEAHRSKKVEIYQDFFSLVHNLLKSSKDGSMQDYAESETFKDGFLRAREGVMFYGSPAVIKAFSTCTMNTSGDADALDALKNYGTLFLAMRKDVGLSNFGLDSLTIHQVYVTDDLSKLK